MGMRKVWADNLVWLLAVVSAAAFMSGSAHAQTALSTASIAAETSAPTNSAAPAAKPAAKSSHPEEPELQEIVVTGIRASLEKSLEIKRDAAVVLDSINATELGRFPDADVADSLSHLPGITITRTTGGEGQKVNVRGLGPQYNIVTLNNRILATDDDGRDLAFDVLPSEVISGADVLKSPQASALEGSIGGTVDLRTASAFENPGFHAGAHAEEDYNSMSYQHGSKYSAYVEDTLADQTIGFLLGGVYSDDHIRTDSLNAYNQDIYDAPPSYPFDGSSPSVPVSVTPCCITFGSIFDNKKREALNGVLEWRPNEDFKLTADGLYTRLTDPQIGYNESYYFPYTTGPDGVTPAWVNPTIKNGLITAVTANYFQPEMVNNTTNRNVDTWLAGLNAHWKPNSKWTLGLDVYQSEANRPEGGEDTFVTAGLVTSGPYAVDTLIMKDLPNALPSLNVLIPPSQLGLKTCPTGTASSTNPGSCSYTALMNSGYLNNNKYWSTHYVGLNGYTVHDQIAAVAFDGAYESPWGYFERLLFGAGGSHHDKNRTDSSNDWTNGSGQYGTLYNTVGCPTQCNPYSFASQGFNVVSLISPPNFMQGAGGSYPITLPALNAGQLLAFLKSLNGKPNPFYCTSYPSGCAGAPPFNFASTLPQPNPYNSYEVTEKTASIYVEAQFAGPDWSGNVGVRVVRTTTTAASALAAPVSLWTPTTAGSTQTWNVQYAPGQASSTNGEYTLALPAVNVSYWIEPDKWQLRGALAETMARPELSQLAPTSYNNAINGPAGNQLFYGGTAGLQPIKAWQADLSLEWYYQAHSALALALFGKKIRDDIYQGASSNVDLGTKQYVGGPPGTPGIAGTPFLWTVYAPANGYKETYTGVELTWQHFLENGLGTHMQFTHVWAKTYDQSGNPIPPISAVPPTTVSASLIYEKGRISTDVTWDYTSSYTQECSQCTEVPGWPANANSFTWLTASAHYKIIKGFDVYLEGKNLTNTVARTYLNGNPLLPWAFGQSVGQSTSGVGEGFSAYGRTYAAGLSYQF